MFRIPSYGQLSENIQATYTHYTKPVTGRHKVKCPFCKDKASLLYFNYMRIRTKDTESQSKHNSLFFLYNKTN